MPIRARQRKEADRIGESQHAVEHLQLAVFSKRTKKSSPTQPKLYNHKQLLLVMREGVAFIYFQSPKDTTLSFLFRTYSGVRMIMMRACCVRIVFLEHGSLGMFSSRQFAPNSEPPSASFLMFCCLYSSLWASVVPCGTCMLESLIRAGWREPQKTGIACSCCRVRVSHATAAATAAARAVVARRDCCTLVLGIKRLEFQTCSMIRGVRPVALLGQPLCVALFAELRNYVPGIVVFTIVFRYRELQSSRYSGVCDVPNSIRLENIYILLWNRRTLQPKANPTQEKWG